jgi:hypothetical protein
VEISNIFYKPICILCGYKGSNDENDGYDEGDDHDEENQEIGNGKGDLKILVKVFAPDQELKSTTKQSIHTENSMDQKKNSEKGEE